MRSPNKRSRSKSNRPKTLGNIVNRVFDSSGPEGKVRGTPQQIIEKYQFLARDAQLSNDRVAAENFQQHAEHYTRMLAQAQREQAAEQEARRQSQDDQRGRNDDRTRQNNGQNNGYAQRQADPRLGDQPDTTRPEMAQPSGAFDVAASEREDDSPLVVDTPENHDAPVTDLADTPAASAAMDPAQKPRNTRKPRAPKADGVQDAPKPRRAPRKPRAPKAEGGAPPAPEMKSSAAE